MAGTKRQSGRPFSTVTAIELTAEGTLFLYEPPR